MLKVMFIDDEPLIRDGMALLIDWEDYGYQVVGSADNGKNGLEKLRLLRPDLVFVDIRMPGLSGIEMIKQAKAEGLHSKYIILSGYSDFAYAQQAIRLGMESYLLKPVDEEELIPLIQQVRQKCLDETQEKYYLSNYKLMQEKQQWQNLLNGTIQDEAWIGQFCQQRFHLVSVIHLSELGKAEVETAFDHYPVFERVWLDSCLYLILEESAYDSFNKQFLERQRLVSRRRFQCQAVAIPMTIRELPQAVRKLNKLQELHFSYDGCVILTEEQLICEGAELSEDWIRSLCNALTFGEEQQIDALFIQLKRYYQTNQLDKQHIITETIERIKDVYLMLAHEHQTISVLSNQVMTDMICQADTLEILLEAIKTQLKRDTASINAFISSGDNIVQKIIEFVERYYYKDLNLKAVAELFNYNNTYLGKKFKKTTNQYFHHYLDQVRIEKAKTFLAEENRKVYEVAEKVGYSSNDYFYKKFKKYVGISPKEYQKSKRKQYI
ncbi:response regulator transcription factor [Gracilibacillus alcaliphilus]|uniref:response regulator transcription factor n=1 Tax=Gracilibacillus alcaliphilus TaxID=1401441 RepID=UPI001959385E|nr:response regulator [Gracilibacillus alcaliphilus]MBM7676426.1 two-component system response regulator YesN [Gracilibacillus alcaliphilus]